LIDYATVRFLMPPLYVFFRLMFRDGCLPDEFFRQRRFILRRDIAAAR